MERERERERERREDIYFIFFFLDKCALMVGCKSWRSLYRNLNFSSLQENLPGIEHLRDRNAICRQEVVSEDRLKALS
jgi:hypothetical protein